LLVIGFSSTIILHLVSPSKFDLFDRAKVMTRGEPLYRLQQLDQELEDSERRISEIRASLGETEALRLARQALDSSKDEHSKWMTRVRDLDLEVASLSSKIAGSEQRLYSGTVTNPKELSDIQSEVASLKRRRATLEDKLLEAMVYGDEAETTTVDCQTTLTNTQADWQADQDALNEELAELETRLESVRDERLRLRKIILADDLALYDKVRARLGSVTVVTLRDGVCGFCAVAPSSTKLGRLRSGRELLQCGNCMRILLIL
jgi:predicted  nucleic acid-binding Zn-ribbon protein